MQSFRMMCFSARVAARGGKGVVNICLSRVKRPVRALLPESLLGFGTPGKTVSSRFITVFALAAALGAGAAQAQKIAIVNMQQAVLATSDGKKAAALINDKFAPVKADFDKLSKDLTAKQDAFTKSRATMSPSAVAAAQAELESLTTALKRKQEDAQQDLQDEENKQLGSIVPKLQQVINAYAVANQLTFVVDTSASPNNLVYADGSINITGAVVAAYEKAAGTPAAVTAPKAPAPAASKTTPTATPGAPAKTTAPAK
jgi:outer membrane protein